MDDTAVRLRCLEIANGEHAGTRLQRAEELYKWVTKNISRAGLVCLECGDLKPGCLCVQPAPASESSGGPTVSNGAPNAAAPGFKVTPDQLAKLDEDELRRMTES